jgi:ABC-2 type transport system ATP-binding protein
LRNVTIDYPVFATRAQSFRVSLLHFGSAGALAKDLKGNISVRALENISFDAEKGDRVGLVGRNGSGKSTLLKLLSGIYRPTSGLCEVEGTISSILGLGLSVDDELSGLEAIRYACIIRGIARERIPEIEADVREFTELGDYLEMPLRTYSAGMRMRLAFAVATSDRPDILLMDEGIGAGDQFFLDRVRARARSFIHSASLLFMASHSEMLVKEICDKALLLDHGRIIAAGPTDEIFSIYHDVMREPSSVPVLSLDQSGKLPHAPAPISEGCVAIASAESAEWPAQAAFDGSPTSCWQTDAAQPGAWVGLSFAEPLTPRTAFLRQRAENFAADTATGQVAVEASDDEFEHDVRVAAEMNIQKNSSLVSIPLGSIGPARQWRFRCLEPTASGRWSVASADFSTLGVQQGGGGAAISSGSSSIAVSADNAFQQRNPAPWVSANRGNEIIGAAWIGWDFGETARPTIGSLSVAQWDEGERPNTVPEVLVQASDDRFLLDIRTLARLTLRQDETPQDFDLDVRDSARYWRIIAAQGTGGGCWGLRYLTFHVAEPDSAAGPALENGSA